MERTRARWARIGARCDRTGRLLPNPPRRIGEQRGLGHTQARRALTSRVSGRKLHSPLISSQLASSTWDDRGARVHRFPKGLEKRMEQEYGRASTEAEKAVLEARATVGYGGVSTPPSRMPSLYCSLPLNPPMHLTRRKKVLRGRDGRVLGGSSSSRPRQTARVSEVTRRARPRVEEAILEGGHGHGLSENLGNAGATQVRRESDSGILVGERRRRRRCR